MIESEFQKSKDRVAKNGTKRVFSTQKANDNDILQSDSYLLI